MSYMRRGDGDANGAARNECGLDVLGMQFIPAMPGNESLVSKYVPVNLSEHPVRLKQRTCLVILTHALCHECRGITRPGGASDELGNNDEWFGRFIGFPVTL